MVDSIVVVFLRGLRRLLHLPRCHRWLAGIHFPCRIGRSRLNLLETNAVMAETRGITARRKQAKLDI
jgi:hypothetical protein